MIPTPTSIPTEEPMPSETPGSSFDPDIDYECENLAELYSYNNVYAYLIPDDGSRDAFTMTLLPFKERVTVKPRLFIQYHTLMKLK